MLWFVVNKKMAPGRVPLTKLLPTFWSLVENGFLKFVYFHMKTCCNKCKFFIDIIAYRQYTDINPTKVIGVTLYEDTYFSQIGIDIEHKVYRHSHWLHTGNLAKINTFYWFYGELVMPCTQVFFAKVHDLPFHLVRLNTWLK